MQNPFEAPSRPQPVASAQGLPGVGRLYGLAWIELGWSLLSYGLLTFFPLWDLSSSALELYFLVMTGVWGGLSAAWAWLLYGYAQGRRGTPAHAVAQSAFLAAVVGVALLVLQEGLTRLGGIDLGQAFNAGTLVLGVAGDVLLVWSVRKSLSSLPSWLVPTYLVLRGVALSLALPQLVLGPQGVGSELFRFARLPLNLAHQGLLIFLLGLGRRGAGSPGAPPEADPGPNAQRDLMVGGAWLIGGLFVTVLSFQTASDGGRYVVTTGAIVYGAVRIGRGLLRGGGAGR